MAPIECRSPAQIADDDLCEAHSSVVRLLNEICNGVCLYGGNRRAALVQLKTQIEMAILGDAEAPDYLRHRICLAIRP